MMHLFLVFLLSHAATLFVGLRALAYIPIHSRFAFHLALLGPEDPWTTGPSAGGRDCNSAVIPKGPVGLADGAEGEALNAPVKELKTRT